MVVAVRRTAEVHRGSGAGHSLLPLRSVLFSHTTLLYRLPSFPMAFPSLSCSLAEISSGRCFAEQRTPARRLRTSLPQSASMEAVQAGRLRQRRRSSRGLLASASLSPLACCSANWLASVRVRQSRHTLVALTNAV